MPFKKVLFSKLLFLAIWFSFVGNASSASVDLGEVEFKTSGSEKVQKHFLHGVAALHSFWYKEALDAFKKSTEIDPSFAMGYWGEAMAHNHPLWEEQDFEAAKKVLLKIPENAKISPREEAYLKAVHILYSDGGKKSRDEAYSREMENLHQKYPDDLEAACFFALSLLGKARGAENKFHISVKAGAIGLEILRKNPNHPCAAHYTIHAFDHPDLAILALPAAKRYAQIAPASHHAQHMPAHIFVQLGMWPEAAKANNEGWKSSIDWVKRDGLPISRRGYHSLQWLHYVLLQQGRWKEANEVLNIKLSDMKEAEAITEGETSKISRRVAKYYDRMVGASVFERENWATATTILDPSGIKPISYSKALLTFVRGFAATVQASPESDKYLSELLNIRNKGIEGNFFNNPERLDIWLLDIKAAKLALKDDFSGAIELMEKAIAIEKSLPAPSGPPRIIKPTHELFGEILLKADYPEKAINHFKVSLARHPNRARSLLGLARSFKMLGKKSDAEEQYSKLISIWKQADHSLPELQEAKDYISQKSTP